MADGDEGKRMRRVQKRADAKEGWTDAKKERFIEVLEATCNIAAGLRAVGMSRSGLTKLRARDGAFRARMADSRKRAYVDLEFFTLGKIMDGTVKTVTKADGSVETVHEYPLHLALQLLRLHRDVADSAAAEEAPDGASDEARKIEVVERLMRKMRKLRERVEQADKAAGGAGADGAGDPDGGGGGGSETGEPGAGAGA
jgi:hypothetical protein